MQKPWSMYNKEEKLRIDDLKSEHVKIILLSIPTSRMGDWYACQEGDIHWQPISAIPDFYEDVREMKGNFQASAPEQEAVNKPVQRRPLFEEAPTETVSTEPSLMVELVKTKERRSARRFPRKLMFKVIQGGKTFESETVDVSMSGLSLVEPLPSWVGKSFRAELNLNKTNVRVMCARVDDKKLKLMDSESWDVIRQWLVNW